MFEGCTAIESIYVSEDNKSFKAINNCLINDSKNIVLACKTSIIPTSASEAKGINTSAFKNCIELTYIEIPANITTIRANAFDGCTNLETVYIPATVTSMGANVFKGCENLTIHFAGEEIPDLWNKDWNASGCTVVLGSAK